MPEESPTLEQDAETENQTDVIPPERHSERERMVESIVAGRHQDLDDDLQDDDYQHEDDVSGKKPEPEKDPEPEEKINVKVNGKEYQVTPEEIKEYQKQRAADERFRELAEERQQVAREKESLEKEREKIAALKQQPVEPRQDSQKLADQILDAVFSEDREKLGEALKGLTANQQQRAIQSTGIDPNTVYQLVDQRDRQRELNGAIKKFETEYPVLAKDFRSAVDERTVIEMEADPSASPWEIIDRAAQHVNQTISSIAGPKEEKPKSRVPSSPVRSKVTARFQPAPKEQRLSAFEEIKRARGQQ